MTTVHPDASTADAASPGPGPDFVPPLVDLPGSGSAPVAPPAPRRAHRRQRRPGR